MSEQKFKLKKGILLDPENNGTHYSNANLTDEIAASILKKNPGLAKHFETIGEDVEKPLDGLKKADLQAKYKEVIGEDADESLTKAELIEAIEAK